MSRGQRGAWPPQRHQLELRAAGEAGQGAPGGSHPRIVGPSRGRGWDSHCFMPGKPWGHHRSCSHGAGGSPKPWVEGEVTQGLIVGWHRGL